MMQTLDAPVTEQITANSNWDAVGREAGGGCGKTEMNVKLRPDQLAGQ